MKRFRRIALSLVLAVALLVVFALPAGAANPTVSITVTAEVVSITNSQAAWDIGTVALNAVVYFSETGAQDDDYSRITNTGSVAVNVAIQGTNIEGGAYDWTLATGAGNQTYSLYANTPSGGATYSVEVKTSGYVNIVSNLPATGSDTYDWSMKFTAPNEFNVLDDGLDKTATVTLVASKYT